MISTTTATVNHTNNFQHYRKLSRHKPSKATIAWLLANSNQLVLLPPNQVKVGCWESESGLQITEASKANAIQQLDWLLMRGDICLRGQMPRR